MRDENGEGPEEEVEDGDDAEDDVPEPEDEVDLGVDDVLCEDAHAIVVLQACPRPNVGHVAGDLRWEGRAHRVVDLPALLL